MKTKPKKKLKTLPKLKAECQMIVNEYIRIRDADEPCISCRERGKTLQAGHYFSVKGYDGLRFDLDNINGECEYCNCFNESHLIGYGDGLLRKLGHKRYGALKQRAADYKLNSYKWSRWEIVEIMVNIKNKIYEMCR